jgi:hypothetical protein
MQSLLGLHGMPATRIQNPPKARKKKDMQVVCNYELKMIHGW